MTHQFADLDDLLALDTENCGTCANEVNCPVRAEIKSNALQLGIVIEITNCMYFDDLGLVGHIPTEEDLT